MIRKSISKLISKSGTFLINKITKNPIPKSPEEWRYLNCSFSQFGEDILISRALEHLGKTKESAYFVDVGAFDPITYSNTLLLHWLGWKGVNIDAQQHHVDRFNKLRPRDTNLTYAISAIPRMVDFLCYSSGTTGRIAPNDGSGLESVLGEEALETKSIQSTTLAAILRDHAPQGKPFGLLTIDCEGSDFEVLQSNDWTTFKPWIIAIEDHSKDLNTEIDSFCRSHGYTLWAMAHVTKIFIRNQIPA